MVSFNDLIINMNLSVMRYMIFQDGWEPVLIQNRMFSELYWQRINYVDRWFYLLYVDLLTLTYLAEFRIGTWY